MVAVMRKAVPPRRDGKAESKNGTGRRGRQVILGVWHWPGARFFDIKKAPGFRLWAAGRKRRKLESEQGRTR